MAAWPGTLPQDFLVNSLGNFRRQPMSQHMPTDVGPGITRPRTNAVSEFFSGAMHLTSTQWDTLLTFHDTTLIGGSQPFDWVHPLTQASITNRMKFDLSQDPYIQIVGVPKPNFWLVQMAFEILPA